MTANGTEISDGESLSGSQVLRVYGTNLTPPYFSLWFNGVEYTPFNYGEGYVEYVLQDNGTYNIKVDDRVFISFEISGITVPSVFPCRINCFQSSASSTGGGNHANSITITGDCINYPYRASEDFPHFRFHFYFTAEQSDLAKFTLTNGTINQSALDGSLQPLINITPTDPLLPVFLYYDGFICAVFNYTTTPQP